MRLAKVLIWFGFIALLAISVPKVAWIVRSYEGATPVLISQWGITIDALWILPLFVAICIDVLILALTYAVSNDKARASQISMWLFVGLLCGLSCYCNLLYNEAHTPDGSIWSNQLVSSITPYILAGVPLFALCYTLILSRLNGNGETLEEKATRLENEKAAKLRIQAVNQGKLTDRLKAAISSVADVASHAKTELLSGSNQDPTPDTPEIQSGSNQDPTPEITEIQVRFNQDPLLDRLLTQSGYNTDRVTDALEIELGSSNGYKADTHQDRETDKETETSKPGTNSSNRSNGSLYVSLADVSMMHGYSVEYLKKLVNAGTIATKKNDKTMLLVSSVNRYVSSHGRKKSDTAEIPALRIVGD